MTPLKHWIIAFFLLFLFPAASNAQMSISWKWIDKKPLSAPIGKGGAENYKEEWGGYDMTIDISKVSCKLPVSILIMFYREKDVWHPVYKNFPTLVKWDNLEMIPLTIETATNRIANTSSSDNPKAFEESWALEITRRTKAPFSVFIPSGLWVGDNYGDKPADYFADTLVVRYFPNIEIHDADERFIRQMWKTTPNFSVSFNLSAPAVSEVKDLGDEDLSDLLTNSLLTPTGDGVKIDEPQASEMLLSWNWISNCQQPTDEPKDKSGDGRIGEPVNKHIDEPTPPKANDAEQHQHRWGIKSVANNYMEHPRILPVVQPWPDDISIDLGNKQQLTCHHTTDEHYLSRHPLTVNQLTAIYSSQLKGKDFPSSDQPIVDLGIEYAHDIIAELNKLAEQAGMDVVFFLPTQEELVEAGVCKREDFKNLKPESEGTLSAHGEIYVTAIKKDRHTTYVSKPYYTVLVNYCRMCLDCHLIDKICSQHIYRFNYKANAENFVRRRQLQ